MTPSTQFPDGELPFNVRLGANTIVTGGKAFRGVKALEADAIVIGSDCTLEGVSFSVGHKARIVMGDFCHLCGCVLLSEELIEIGSYVSMGWNVVVADSDFHPIAPAERMADAIACSNLGAGRARPPILKRPVVIEDDVWIGPNATILKGVRIGWGSWIEPGAVVTHDIPPRSRVLGNPAKVVGAV